MMSPQSLSLANWALKQFNDSKAKARRKLYADYDAGRHQLNFATDKFLSTFGTTFQALSENLCPLVIDSLNDTLQIEGFVPTKVSGKRAIAGIRSDLDEIWRANRMQRRAGEIHRDALLFEESFAIVWPDREDPRLPIIYPNVAGSVVARFHPTKLGMCIEGAKWWIEAGKIRLTLYFTDRIEKYVSTSAQTWLPASAIGFRPFYEPDDSEPWPLPNPFGKVPIFRFVNDPGVDGAGKGELRDVIPLQNGLNKSLCDMMVAAEFEAFAQRWATGLEVQKDKNQNPINPFRSGPGNIWTSNKADAKFGEFSRADLAKFIEVQNGWRGSIGRVSRTPLHQLVLDTSGDWPSGEALKTACEPQTKKAIDRQLLFGSTWDDLARFCLEIRGRADVSVETQWGDAAPRAAEAESWQTAISQQQAGVSIDQTLRERGYSDEQIESFKAAPILPKPTEKTTEDDE